MDPMVLQFPKVRAIVTLIRRELLERLDDDDLCLLQAQIIEISIRRMGYSSVIAGLFVQAVAMAQAAVDHAQPVAPDR